MLVYDETPEFISTQISVTPLSPDAFFCRWTFADFFPLWFSESSYVNAETGREPEGSYFLAGGVEEQILAKHLTVVEFAKGVVRETKKMSILRWYWLHIRRRNKKIKSGLERTLKLRGAKSRSTE